MYEIGDYGQFLVGLCPLHQLSKNKTGAAYQVGIQEFQHGAVQRLTTAEEFNSHGGIDQDLSQGDGPRGGVHRH